MRFIPFLLLSITLSMATHTTQEPCEGSKCIASVSKGCQGLCFVAVADKHNDLDKNTDFLELLCSKECAGGWSSNATLDCLKEEQTEYSLGVVELVERLTNEVCPLTCYHEAVTKQVEKDCSANETCSGTCRNGLSKLSRDCRNVVARSTNPDFADFKLATLRIFTACGLEFDPEVPALEQEESPSEQSAPRNDDE